ncbi:MAG: ATP-binding protein [Patescibacteria group bacterium]|nr:ATP-binding protein [Patescibacteria group bacterium]
MQRFETGKIELYKERVSLDDFFLDSINNIKLLDENLEVKFIYPNKKIYMDIDKVQFTQVISNLLNNALKFANKETPKILLSVREKQNGDIIIDIEDNGK